MSSSSPNLSLASPAPAPLTPEDKIPLRATGRFDVQSRERLFADLPAYWRTYASVNMRCSPSSIRPASSWDNPGPRMMGCGTGSFRLRRSQRPRPARLRYGRQVSPGLRVVYRRQPPARDGKRPPKAVVATIYLAFEDEASRARVWADLVADVDVTSAGRG